MAARPTLFYPTPPKPEWFMSHATGMSSASVGNVTLGPKSDLSDVFGAVGSYFTKMDSEQYTEYITAHLSWVTTVNLMDETLHHQKLKRQALESFREVPGLFYRLDETGTLIPSDLPPSQTVPLPPVDGEKRWLNVYSEKKEEHPPQLSTKPHRAEKRDLKKKLRDAKVAKTNEALKARTEIAKEATASEIKKTLEKVQEVKDLAPLHKAELAAAKSAAARAKQIRFGSSDYTTNVEVDGWKVVTRKKGDYWPQFARVDEQLASPGAAGHTSVRMDPSIGSLGSLALSSLRKPTQVGSSK